MSILKRRVRVENLSRTMNGNFGCGHIMIARPIALLISPKLSFDQYKILSDKFNLLSSNEFPKGNKRPQLRPPIGRNNQAKPRLQPQQQRQHFLIQYALELPLANNNLLNNLNGITI